MLNKSFIFDGEGGQVSLEETEGLVFNSYFLETKKGYNFSLEREGKRYKLVEENSTSEESGFCRLKEIEQEVYMGSEIDSFFDKTRLATYFLLEEELEKLVPELADSLFVEEPMVYKGYKLAHVLPNGEVWEFDCEFKTEEERDGFTLEKLKQSFENERGRWARIA